MMGLSMWVRPLASISGFKYRAAGNIRTKAATAIEYFMKRLSRLDEFIIH